MKATRSQNRFYIFLFCSVLLSCASIYYSFWGLGFSHDDLVFLTAKNAPQAFDTDFLYHIFFRPNSYNTHYRPFGFFGYFFTMGRTFGMSPLAFDLFGVLLLVVNASLFLNVLQKINNNMRLNFGIALLYIVHFGFLRVFLNYSDHLKYGVTLFFLFLMLEKALKPEKLSSIDLLYLFFLQVLAIGCQEASFLFAFVFIGFRWFFVYRFHWSCLAVGLPSVVYLLARVFIWGVPKTGYFAVNWTMSPVFFMQQIGFFLFPTNLPFSRGQWHINFLISFIVLVAASIGLFASLRGAKASKIRPVLFCLFCWFLLQLPQSPLVHHWDFTKLKALVWPTPFFFIGLALVAPHFKATSRQLGFAVLFLIFTFGAHRALGPHVQRKNNEISVHQTHFLRLIERRFNECPQCLVKIENIRPLIDEERCEPFFIRNYTIPSLLALYYPTDDFEILYEGKNKYRRAYVKDGYVYYQESDNQARWVDIFGFDYRPPSIDNGGRTSSRLDGSIEGLIWSCLDGI